MYGSRGFSKLVHAHGFYLHLKRLFQYLGNAVCVADLLVGFMYSMLDRIFLLHNHFISKHVEVQSAPGVR